MSGCECEQFNIQRPASSLCKALLKTTCHVQKGIHLGGLKHELKGLYKDRELTRTKRLFSIENDSDNGETAAAACREKTSNCFYNFRSISRMLLLMLQPEIFRNPSVG